MAAQLAPDQFLRYVSGTTNENEHGCLCAFGGQPTNQRIIQTSTNYAPNDVERYYMTLGNLKITRGEQNVEKLP